MYAIALMAVLSVPVSSQTIIARSTPSLNTFAGYGVGEHSNGSSKRSDTLRTIGNIIAPGGYFLTSSSGQSALGSNKFLNEFSLLTRPKKLGGLRVSAGGQWISTSDHYLPFTSDRNSLWLIGPVVRLSTPRVDKRPQLFVTAGYYAGRLKSDTQGFTTTQFVPGASAGADIPVARYVSLRLAYRVQGHIRGVNTDGLQASINIR
jgi:hypothetical protein